MAIITSCSDDDEVKGVCSGDIPHAVVQMKGNEAIATWAAYKPSIVSVLAAYGNSILYLVSCDTIID